MSNIKIVESGILKGEEISKLKLFPKNSGVQRQLDEKNVRNIMRSMEKNYIPSTIKVNKDWYILDGQHSIEAIKRLGFKDISVSYTMYDTDGKDREACILLNTNSKKWDMDDYTELWSNNGNENYIWFKNFKKENNLSFFVAYLAIFEQHIGSAAPKREEFMNGEMKINELQKYKARQSVEYLKEVKKYIPQKMTGRNFELGFLRMAINEDYDHRRMINKLENFRDKVYKCSSQAGYTEMLQEIYNYKSRIKIDFMNK